MDNNCTLDLTDTFQIMRKLRKHEAMQVIKTWCNSWSTSYRYHEDNLLPCLLGCPSRPDDLSHYICCPHVWSTVGDCFPQLELASPLARLGVESPSRERLITLAGIFQAYHGTKLNTNIVASVPIPFAAARQNFTKVFQVAVAAAGLKPASGTVA